MKRRFSKAMLNRVSKLTKKVFDDSVLEIMFDPKADVSELDLAQAAQSLRVVKLQMVFDPSETFETLMEAKRQVDELYLSKLLSLTTKQLEEIMIVHDHGDIKRMPRTVEAIISELARRSLLEDSNESDPRKEHGEADGHKEKSSIRSKKATVTRNKATKSNTKNRAR